MRLVDHLGDRKSRKLGSTVLKEHVNISETMILKRD